MWSDPSLTPIYVGAVHPCNLVIAQCLSSSAPTQHQLSSPATVAAQLTSNSALVATTLQIVGGLMAALTGSRGATLKWRESTLVN